MWRLLWAAAVCPRQVRFLRCLRQRRQWQRKRNRKMVTTRILCALLLLAAAVGQPLLVQGQVWLLQARRHLLICGRLQPRWAVERRIA